MSPDLLSGDQEEDNKIFKSIAVLYLENLSNDSEGENWCAGITDGIITSISKLGIFNVKSRTDVLQFRRKVTSHDQIGEILGVDAYITGSLQKVGEKVFANISLIDTRNGVNIWAERFEKTTSDIFNIPKIISKEIARSLGVGISPETLSSSAFQEPGDNRTFSLLGKGINLLDSGDFQKSIAVFDSVLINEPDNAHALFSRAQALENLEQYPAAIKAYEKILPAGNQYSRVQKIWEHPDLKNKKNELAKQKQLEGKIDIFEKRISDTEKEIETQSLIENRIAQLEKGFVSSKQETNKKEDINIDKTGEIKEIKIDENLKNDLSNAKNWDLSEEAIERELSQIKNSKYDVEQEKLRTSEIIREQEKQLKSLYEEKSELNQNMLDFQKNRNHLQSEFIYKQKELIKKYEDEIKEFQNLNKINNEKLVNLEEKNNDLNNKEDELKNLNQKSNEKILDLKETNKNLKNKDDKIKHYQNDNLRLSKELFENSKKLEDHKIQINKFENNKSQIQEQIYNLNKIISKNNIVKNHFDLFSQNKDVQNISKITVKEKPDIELTTNHENVEEKNKVLEELNLKTKDIFAK